MRVCEAAREIEKKERERDRVEMSERVDLRLKNTHTMCTLLT